MTLAASTAKVAYSGDGTTAGFAVSFPFFDPDELEVIERSALGVETVKALNTHYTVTGGGGATGTVTMGTAPASGVQLHIRRATARIQDSDYTANDTFPAETTETNLDRLIAIAQEVARELNRAALLAKTSPTAGPLTIPEPSAGKVLQWNDAGTDLENSTYDPDTQVAAAAGYAAAAAASEAAAAASAAGLAGTSTTSLSIGTGAKVFTTQSGKLWTLGQRLRAASDDGTKIMDGEVTAYSGTSLTIDVDYTEGAGTHADWNIGLIGPRGATGAAGAAGAGSGDIVGPASVTGDNFVQWDGTTGDLVKEITPGDALTAMSGVPTARTLTAGTGMAEIGDLSADRTIAADVATAGEYRSATADKLLTPAIAFAAMAEVTLTDGANIAWDMTAGFDFTVTLAGNRAMTNPTVTNVIGKKGRLRVVQDGTGSRTITWGTNYEFAAGTAPTLTTTASAQDILYYDVISATRILITVGAKAIS